MHIPSYGTMMGLVMSEIDLITETNQLLRRFLEMQEERARASAEMSQVMQEHLVKARTNREETLNAKILQAGEPDLAKGTSEEWHARMERAQADGEVMRQQAVAAERLFRDDMLAELRKQTELLEQIAEKLGS